MTIYDGTDDFEGIVTAAQLNTTAAWHGASLPTAGTNEVPTNGLFLQDGVGFFENTGTLASPVWTLRSGNVDTVNPVLLEEHIASGTESSFDVVPSSWAVDTTDLAYIIIEFGGSSTGGLTLQMQEDSRTTNYWNQRAKLEAGVQTLTSEANTSEASLGVCDHANAEFYFKLFIPYEMDAAIANYVLVFYEGWINNNDPTANYIRGTWKRVDTAPTSKITFKTSTSTWKIDTKIRVWGFKNT